MGGGSEPKQQLGKIMLQRKLVTPDELSDMLEEQKNQPGARLASTMTMSGRISMSEALDALGEQHGVASIDLTQQVVELSQLNLVGHELAQEKIVFPFALQDDALSLASQLLR